MKYIYTIAALSLLFSCSTPTDPQPLNYASEPVTTPVPFAPGVISSDNHDEFDINFTPDGTTAYFTRRVAGEKQHILQSNFIKGEWTTPVRASFSTDRDETTSITPDGNTLYFGSERPIPGQPNLGGFDMNIWSVQRNGENWGTPQPLPEPINAVQEEGEQWPSSNANFFFTLDGETFYYTTMIRGTQTIEIFTTQLSDGEFSTPEKISGLFDDDSVWKYSAVLSPDGRYLLFNSYGAPGGAGGEDLYISRKTDEGWGKAKALGPMINTAGEESSPRFSRDGKFFFYSHADLLGDEEYGPWNIFFVETEALDLDGMFD